MCHPAYLQFLQSYTSSPPRYDAFAATVDNWYENDAENMFLPKHPLEMLEEANANNVSLILGVTRGDGGLLTSSVESSKKLRDELRSNWHNFSCVVNDYPCTRETEGVSDRIRKHYFGRTQNDDPTLNIGNLTQLISETVFFYPAYKAAIAHSRVAPTRGASGPNAIPQSLDLGLLLLQGILNKLLFVLDIIKVRFSSQEYQNWGPTHGDDVLMLFDPFGIELVSPSSKDYAFSNTFVQGFAGFAANNESQISFGNVTCPIINSKDKSNLMVLESPPKVTKNVLIESVKFWDEIYNETKSRMRK